MRSLLNRFFALSLWLAALNLVAIAVLVGAQVSSRVLDKIMTWLGFEPFSGVILSLAEIAGYLLAAASFLALAGTLKAGVHVRMTMLLSALGEKARRRMEFCALGIGALFSGFMTYHACRLVQDSWINNEVSTGIIRFQLAYPQATVAFGLMALTIALVDEMVSVARTGQMTFGRSELQVMPGEEE
ncbi:MAG: TRAP transporter small permease [Rhodospirillales bacterium]